MITTMDKAGRVVIPASVRDRLGMTAGPIDILIDGNSVRIEVPAPDNVVERDGLLVITTAGAALTDDDVRELRLADQR